MQSLCSIYFYRTVIDAEFWNHFHRMEIVTMCIMLINICMCTTDSETNIAKPFYGTLTFFMALWQFWLGVQRWSELLKKEPGTYWVEAFVHADCLIHVVRVVHVSSASKENLLNVSCFIIASSYLTDWLFLRYKNKGIIFHGEL